MTVVPGFSVDPSGLWSLRQAKAVLDIINPEAYRRGLLFQMVDVTTYQMPEHRVLLSAHCLIHEVAVPLNDACPICLQQNQIRI